MKGEKPFTPRLKRARRTLGAMRVLACSAALVFVISFVVAAPAATADHCPEGYEHTPGGSCRPCPPYGCGGPEEACEIVRTEVNVCDALP